MVKLEKEGEYENSFTKRRSDHPRKNYGFTQWVRRLTTNKVLALGFAGCTTLNAGRFKG